MSFSLNYKELFGRIRECCSRGLPEDIDFVISLLDENVELPVTRAVDRYLAEVTSPEGIRRIEYYLFMGTLIQRNYSTLYFSRKNEWDPVNRAYKAGLIDAVQAYSR